VRTFKEFPDDIGFWESNFSRGVTMVGAERNILNIWLEPRDWRRLYVCLQLLFSWLLPVVTTVLIYFSMQRGTKSDFVWEHIYMWSQSTDDKKEPENQVPQIS
jgi:hypothetical protein